MSYIQQYVSQVKNYSSEYGDVESYSYVANNIVGKPHISNCREIGDFASSFSLQTYGETWHQDIRYCPVVNTPSAKYSPALDFIDISFEVAACPHRITFTEICNPGPVLRIWALKKPHTWLLIWDRSCMKSFFGYTTFDPNIKPPGCSIQDFRIEYDQSKLEYYYGCQAIMMEGSLEEDMCKMPLTRMLKQQNKETFFQFSQIILGASYLASEEFNRCFTENVSTSDQEDSIVLCTSSLNILEQSNGYFGELPVEVLFHILRYLDLESLSKVSQCCKLLNSACADPFIFQNLNLRNSWMYVNPSLMEWLKRRATNVCQLDFSWCGNRDIVSESHLAPFLTNHLTDLHLQCCLFLSDKGFQTIAKQCKNLVVLKMGGCSSLTPEAFTDISFPKLTHLDVSKTQIGADALLAIANSCRNRLVCLQIVNCVRVSLTKLLAGLASMNVNLMCLEAWKTRHLTLEAYHCIAKFTDLEILDIGWCTAHDVGIDISEGVAAIIYACKKLKVFILTSARSINDHALSVISLGGKNLELLDISGNRYVTPAAVTKLLDRRQEHLKRLDVSHCPSITMEHVDEWKMWFPSVKVERNHI